MIDYFNNHHDLNSYFKVVEWKILACHATSPHSQSHWAHPFPRTGRQSFLEQEFFLQRNAMELT